VLGGIHPDHIVSSRAAAVESSGAADEPELVSMGSRPTLIHRENSEVSDPLLGASLRKGSFVGAGRREKPEDTAQRWPARPFPHSFLRSVVSAPPLAKLRELEGADHAFRVPKGRNAAAELAEPLATWTRTVIGR